MTTPGTPDFNDAYALLTAMLAEWGLTDLDGAVREILVEGYSPETAVLRLRETPQYKERFKANALRIKAGLPALSEAEYVATEREYHSTLREFGLPEGFYDSRDDFTRWLETDVSPQELRDRAQMARVAYLDTSQDVRDQWERLYGLRPGDAVAAFLDEDKALGLLERRARSTTIAAEAYRAFRGDYQITSARAEELADFGVTQELAQRGFSDVASRLDRDQFLGRLAGEDFTQREAEDDVLLNNATAARERDRIYNAEEARFRQNYLPTTSAGLSRDGGNF